MHLHGTPLSHFTRKVRILLGELGVAYEFVHAPGVLATTAEAYGNNPLMRVPTLVNGDDLVFDSDHIARYLVARFDSRDWFGVTSTEVLDLDRLAVANGVMANEVVLILARRGGLEDLDSVVYFRKLHGAIEQGLAWLDAKIVAEAEFDYRDIALVCMWQHLEHYQLIAGLDRFGRIAARVARFADRPTVAATRPESPQPLV